MIREYLREEISSALNETAVVADDNGMPVTISAEEELRRLNAGRISRRQYVSLKYFCEKVSVC